MWLLADYEFVSLFSLKSSAATGSGAKSLLVPTPYALKMALLDVACHTGGIQPAQAVWPTIRDAAVAYRLPRAVVVTNLFTKVLKPRRNEAEEGSADEGPFGRTIAFREYVQYLGPLGIALQVPDQAGIADLLMQVNYLGKRGGFVQMLDLPREAEELPSDYVRVTGEMAAFPLQGVIQLLDDCEPSLTFGRANVYSSDRVTLGKDRVLRHVVLPYRLARSSKSYSHYERIE